MSIKFLYQNAKFLAACGFILLCPALLAAQKYTGLPVTKDRLLKAIKSKQLSVPTIVQKIKEKGVNFNLTDAVEEELRAVKANRLIIEAVGANYRNQKPPVQTASRNTGSGGGRGTAVVPAGGGSGGGDNGYSGEDAAATEKYEQLYYQGVQIGSQLQTATSPQQVASIAQSVKKIGEQAISLDPTRPEAYTLVGGSLMMTGNFNEAEKYGQEAINRGGSLAFQVYHMSGTPHPETLFVARGFITIESNQKYFHFAGASQVLGTREQGYYNLPNGASVPVFSVTTSKDNRTDQWDFAPGMTGTVQEAQMIMRLIRNNVK